MTKARVLAGVVVVGFLLAPVAAWAPQSRQDVQQMQLLEDLRVIEQQLQQLRSAVAALAEQAKAANTRLDLQSETIRTNHAGDADTLRNIQTQVNALTGNMTVYAQQVNRFAAEIPALRLGLDQQQRQLDKILAALTVPVPTAPGDVNTGAPPPQGTPLPASPGAAFNQAKTLYAQGDLPLAAKTFGDFIQNFPGATAYLGDANYWMGLAQAGQGKYAPALAAFQAVTETYKTSDNVADAYFQQGECYRALGKKPEALAAYDEVIKRFPDTSAAIQAKTKRPLVVK